MGISICNTAASRALCALGVLLAVSGCVTMPAGDDPSVLPPINGTIQYVDGGYVLHVHGTHAQRGYAQGRLIGRGIKRVFDSMYLHQLFDADGARYALARVFIIEHMIIDQPYRAEAGGIIRGMRDAGVSMHSDTVGRDMDSLDVLVMSCLQELYTIADIGGGCSSLSNWGSSTRNDTALEGQLCISRHWDYSLFPAMLENLTLIVHHPAEPGLQPWICMGWAGTVGCCSAVNGSRVGGFLNYGLVDTVVNPGPYLPVSLALRQAVEAVDYNGDGLSTPVDIADAYRSHPAAFPAIVHAVSWTAVDSHALIVEVNNHRGVQVRTVRDNNDSLGAYLIATNHFRAKYLPAPQQVYPAIVESLSVSPAVSIDRQAAIIAGAGGWSGTTYRVQYVPATGLLRWGCAVPGIAAHLRGWNEFLVAELLGATAGS